MSVDFSYFTNIILIIITGIAAAYGGFTLLSNNRFADFRNILKKNGLLFILGLYLIGLSYVFIGNKDAAMSNTYFNIALIAGPIILAFIFLLRNSTSDTNFLQTFKLNSSVVLPLVFIGFLFGLFLYTDGVDKDAFKFFGNVLLISIFVVGAIIFFQIFKNIAYSLEGLQGIIARLILFIPCMISDFFAMFFEQLSSSPFVVYVLLALEVLLILGYIFLPKLLKHIDGGTGKYVLVTEPIVLKQETRVIGAADVFEKLGLAPLIKPRTGNMALSMWIYVVPMSSNHAPYNEEATVFEFGNQHPRITYKQSMLKVYYAPEQSYETRIPTQTWVHIVYNYKDNNVDLFINGNLVKTASYPMLMTNPEDMFVVGQQNGIHGGLVALVYSKHALTDLEIKRFYEIGKDKDPPTA
jgi:hypothetical protein